MRHTACAMLVLPEHLAPLLRPEPHLDVLGTCDPWVVPDGWLEETQQKIKTLAEDPRGQGGVPPSGSWNDGTSGAVPFLWNLVTFLPSAIPVWAGSYASLGDVLLKPWLSDSYTPTEPRITYYVNSDDTWHLDLLVAPARPRRRGPDQGARADPRVRRRLRRGAAVRAARRDVDHDAAPGPRRPRAAQAPRGGGLGHDRQDLARAGLHRARTPRSSRRAAAGPPSCSGRSAASTPPTRCSARWSAGPRRSTR